MSKIGMEIVAQIFCVYLVLGIALLSCSGNKEEREISASNPRIIESPPLSPEEQRKAFRLPPGFEIEIFASEPEIGKPMNMVFDLDGRLWVTQSQEYPFPAEEGRGRDKITVLEDTNGDGKADVFIDFTDGLNIPIGILPVHDGAVAFSIPSIWHFTDSNADDRSDEQIFLYGEFDYEDTHGMVNSLSPGFDGWIYAGHGYKNISEVKGIATETIRMESGNTFRFKKDGSAIEVTTTGRVNPFGLTFDKWGYQYSSDSHSDPIYQLIPGGDYPHFGKSPSGIGYAPRMMDHDHGPTAIAGVAINDMNQFPAEYQNSMFNGNVVSNRIFRDSLAWHGATPVAVHKGEFLTSQDKWFRPVDMTMGPDGALYIADFYNRIIGHYEVPLDHEGRDRQRGRIWRITYNGNAADVPKWSQANLETLLQGLNNVHLNTRLRVADQICYEFGEQAIPALKSLVQNHNNPPVQRAHGLWLLHRLDALSKEMITGAAEDKAEIVRVHTMRILGEKNQLNQQLQSLLITALQDGNAHVQRAAVEALAGHISEESFKPVLNFIKDIPEYDTHLQHAASITLRDHLKNSRIMHLVENTDWDEQSRRILTDHMIGVASVGAANFLLVFIEDYSISEDKVEVYATHVVRHLSGANQDELIRLFRERMGDNFGVQRSLFRIVQSEMARRGEPLGAAAQNWGGDLAGHFLRGVPVSKSVVWHNIPLSESEDRGIPWINDERISEDGSVIQVLTNRFRNGQFNGVLISPVIKLENKFGFYLHIRDADINSTPNGYTVRLRLNQTDEVIREIMIHDKENFESNIEWDVSSYTGHLAYLEVAAEVRGGHRHIAIGGFSNHDLKVPEVSPSELNERLQFAADMARNFGLIELMPQLEKVLDGRWFGFQARAAAGDALIRLNPTEYRNAVKQRLVDDSEPLSFRNRLIEMLGEETTAGIQGLLVDILPETSERTQLEISRSLASSPAGAQLLLDAAGRGFISNHILQDPSIVTRFEGFDSPELRESYRELAERTSTSGEDDKRRLIDQRLAEFDPTNASLVTGRQIFESICSSCHQLGQGGDTIIGPQLDGIGSRDVGYIAEKILDPNATIATGWRINNIRLKSGEVRSGLFQRKEGSLLIFADFRGNEFSIAENQIEERTESNNSIMPDFSRILSPEEFQDLLAFLMSQ